MSNSSSTELHPDYIRMYYEHQYGRYDQLEQRALHLTTIFVAIFTFAMPLIFSSTTDLSVVVKSVLAFTMILINVFAVLYLYRTGIACVVHRSRARAILLANAPLICAYNVDYPSSRWPWFERIVHSVLFFGFLDVPEHFSVGIAVQIFLHYILSFLPLVLLVNEFAK